MFAVGADVEDEFGAGVAFAAGGALALIIVLIDVAAGGGVSFLAADGRRSGEGRLGGGEEIAQELPHAGSRLFRILDSIMAAEAETEFRRGVELFNAGQFFEAHEALEAAWTPLKGPRRFFLQALIHLAVGFYHHERGNQAGAVRQLRKGLKKLAAYLPSCEQIDTAAIYRAAAECLERIQAGDRLEQFPCLRWSAANRETARA
jgi:hypothetical protein